MRIDSSQEPDLGFFDFLSFQIVEIDPNKNLELEFEWDYSLDPLTTPTIIHEWEYLDFLVSEHVTKNAEIVVSIGGGEN